MLHYDLLKTPATTLEPKPSLQYCVPNDNLLTLLVSAVTGSSFRTNQLRLRSKKETSDVFQSALSLQGLPLGIIAEGQEQKRTHAAFQKTVAALMNELALFLDSFVNSSFLTDEALITRAEKHFANLNPHFLEEKQALVAFSAVAVFKNSRGELKGLSLSLGNTLIALNNGEKIETVIPAQESQSPDASLCFPSKGEPPPIKFAVLTLKPYDSLLFLSDGVYKYFPLATEEKKADDPTAKATVFRQFSLREDSVPLGMDVFSIAKEADNQVFKDFSTYGGKPTSLGDDLTAATLTIPSEESQTRLQEFLYAKAKEKLDDTLGQTSLPSAVRERFQLIRTKIEYLRNLPSPDLPALSKALIKTEEVLRSRENSAVVSDYLLYVKQEICGRTAFLWKALGITMVAAGTTLVILGGLTFGLSLGSGVGLLTAGAGLLGAGTLFYKRGKNQDLRGEMLKAAELYSQVNKI